MDIYKHPNASGIILLARLLKVKDLHQVRRDKLMWWLQEEFGVELGAANYPARIGLSNYQYCIGCGTVTKLDVAMPIVIHRYCGNCCPEDYPYRKWGVFDPESLFAAVDTNHQQLALQYLYERSLLDANTTSET